MRRIEIALSHCRYEVVVSSEALTLLGEELLKSLPNSRAVLLADESVYALYGKTAEESLRAAGYSVLSHTFEASEENKNLDTVKELYSVLVKNSVERGVPIISLGGGVCGDVVGFVAATYLRGLPFVQCPTTLLAMVDAAVGGKVGVNLPAGKNLIGSFYQPRLVLVDSEVLKSLSIREFRSGLAECIKHAVIGGEEMMAWTERSIDKILLFDRKTLSELLCRNIDTKASIVTRDERENDLRAVLNFGHTFGHAVEKTAGWGKFKHGEAVSLGMIAATNLAVRRKLCKPSLLNRLGDILNRAGLPLRASLETPTALTEAMKTDKKMKGERLRLVLPEQIGEIVVIDDAGDEEIESAWQAILE